MATWESLPGTADEERLGALYRAVGLGPPRYTRDDVAELAGIEHEHSVQWWRAMGFPEVPDDVIAFNDVDVQVARRLAALSGSGVIDDESIMRLARVLGASFSRIADAQLAALEHALAALPAPDAREGKKEGAAPASDLAALLDEATVGALEETLLYVWRRHLVAALGRRVRTDAGAAEVAVAFADLSGFTKLSLKLPAADLARLVDAFETAAFDIVPAHGGRPIKLVGDEVMFVAPTVTAAVSIALDMADRLRTVPDMPLLHCGIAFGPTVAVGGDVFGEVVNLAARLTTLARAGTIVVPRALAAELEGRDDLALVRVRRSFHLKGIGDMRIVAVRARDSRD
jgi:adenylate cyclase